MIRASRIRCGFVPTAYANLDTEGRECGDSWYCHGRTTELGRAGFGFASRYHQGASIPEGQTEFRVQAGGLNFHSPAQDWLAVTGSNYAMFKGTGYINNDRTVPHRFRIWAGDGTGPDGADTFRIWSEAGGGENVIYDNGMDQPITGGNIVVHTGK